MIYNDINTVENVFLHDARAVAMQARFGGYRGLDFDLSCSSGGAASLGKLPLGPRRERHDFSAQSGQKDTMNQTEFIEEAIEKLRHEQFQLKRLECFTLGNVLSAVDFCPHFKRKRMGASSVGNRCCHARLTRGGLSVSFRRIWGFVNFDCFLQKVC